MTWPEVADYLTRRPCVILPTGSIEQHGPIGLIGTDAICASEIAWRAGDVTDTIVAPPISYAPAPFNTSFPGTVSITAELFEALAAQIMQGLHRQGFTQIYVLNGHGANVEPLQRAAKGIPAAIRVRSWWDFAPVNALRQDWYGAWEGMHATPSEVAITQATHRIVPDPGLEPPCQLTPEYMKAHAGDKHGPPDQHRADFPDGRVGSHSSLARPEQGAELLRVAAQAVADDLAEFTG